MLFRCFSFLDLSNFLTGQRAVRLTQTAMSVPSNAGAETPSGDGTNGQSNPPPVVIAMGGTADSNPVPPMPLDSPPSPPQAPLHSPGSPLSPLTMADPTLASSSPAAPTTAIANPVTTPSVVRGDGTHNASSGIYARPEDAARNVTVGDPVQQGEGMSNKYISYRVQVQPGGPENAIAGAGGRSNYGHHTSVLRRYTDFRWLQSQLRREKPGAVVPPLPEKHAVKRLDPEFVEDRRAGLERFLRRCCVHPELRDAQCLGAFLTADDLSFHAAKNKRAAPALGVANTPSGELQPGSPIDPSGADSSYNPVLAPPMNLEKPKKNRLKNWLAETTTALSRELVQSPDDHLFDEISHYIDELEIATKRAHHEAASIVRRHKDVSQGWSEFGRALTALGVAEGEGVDASAGLVGEAATSNLAPIVTDAVESAVQKLEEPLNDHVRILHSVRAALQKRHDRRLTYTTALGTVTNKHAILNKLKGGASAQQSSATAQMKAYDAELSMGRAQEAAEAARIDYEHVSSRVLREMDRFKAEQASNLRATLAEFCRAMGEYHARMGEGWGELTIRLANAAVPPAPTNTMMSMGGDVAQTGDTARQNHLPLPLAPPMPGHQSFPVVAQPQVIAPPVNGQDHSTVHVGGMQYRDTSSIVM